MEISCWSLLMFLIMGWIAMTSGQVIDGCPMYGCRPSGTFSLALDVPRSNVTINWVNEFFLGPVPDGEGCVGNSYALVCQSNGPGPADAGLMGLSLDTGQVRWRDRLLRFPSLPVLDNAGNLWGTDGSNLVHYDVNGNPLSSAIPLRPRLRPLFGVQFVDPDLLLLVSETGQISTILANGVPMANLLLRGNVDKVDGTFIPVAPAVVNGNRFYVVTEFLPDNNTQYRNLGLQRLYAIDTLQSITELIKVVWYADFEKESPRDGSKTLRYTQHVTLNRLVRKMREPSVTKPSILWDDFQNTVYISLPPPTLPSLRYKSSTLRSKRTLHEAGSDALVAVKDMGNYSTLVFKAALISASNMVLYESNMRSRNPTSGLPPVNAGAQLWISLHDNKLLAVEPTGIISKVIDVSQILKTNFSITSKITAARFREVDEDYLIFGIQVQDISAEFIDLVKSRGVDISRDIPRCYVIGVDTPENERDPVHPDAMVWMVPTPDDTVVQGQIIGIQGDNSGRKAQLIAYSQIDSKFGKLFSIV